MGMRLALQFIHSASAQHVNTRVACIDSIIASDWLSAV